MNVSREVLERLYVVEKNSVSIIAEKFGCSEHKINYWLAEFKIPKRSISESVYLYHNPLGDPFKILSPQTTEEAFLFGMGLGLYWGEGNKSNKNAVRLGNTDPKLVRKFIEFLVKSCNVKKGKLRFGLQIFSDMPPEQALKLWQDELKIPRKQFFPSIVVTPARSLGTYRQKTKHGVLTIYYGNKKLRDVLCQILENMK